MQDLSDIDLVMTAKVAGDDTAFAVLVRRHQGRLRAFLTRLCADASLADDIAQDTFLKAYAALASFKGGGSFRSWLCAIAYREFLQHRRKVGAAARIEDALQSQAEHSGDNTNGLEAGLSMDLRRALAQLEDKERAALILCDAMGMSHSEAATTLTAPLGSIKTYIARARDKMRIALSPPEMQNHKQEPARQKKEVADVR